MQNSFKTIFMVHFQVLSTVMTCNCESPIQASALNFRFIDRTQCSHYSKRVLLQPFQMVNGISVYPGAPD